MRDENSRPGDARPFEHRLLLRFKALQIPFDHLADAAQCVQPIYVKRLRPLCFAHFP